MLFRSPVVRFFSRILNRVTITVVLVALQLLWLCWVAFAITTGTGRVWGERPAQRTEPAHRPVPCAQG